MVGCAKNCGTGRAHYVKCDESEDIELVRDSVTHSDSPRIGTSKGKTVIIIKKMSFHQQCLFSRALKMLR